MIDLSDDKVLIVHSGDAGASLFTITAKKY